MKPTESLSYQKFSKNKIADVSITYSLNNIKESISRFLNWKSQALTSPGSGPTFPQNDLDLALNQLDLIIISKPSILDSKEGEVAMLLAQSVLPLQGEWLWYDEDLSLTTPKWNIQQEFIQSSLPITLVTSLHFLQLLNDSSDTSNKTLNEEKFSLFMALSCYLYKGYPWSENIPLDIHDALISQINTTIEKYPWYVDKIFSDAIKPSFVKASSHPEVSSAGRKLFTGNKDEIITLSHTFSHTFMEDTGEKEVWKKSKSYVISFLEAYIGFCKDISSSSSGSKIQNQWSFFVPCILNIIDYHNPAYKRKGADLLVSLISGVSPEFFRRTGVSSVFWDALKPSLTFLTPGTPASIAVPLSQSTFNAMMKLSYFPTSSKITPQSLQEEYLLEGVFRGVSHSHRSTAAMIQFINAATIIVSSHLKSYTTPHIKPLIAIVSGTLGDPFIVYSFDLLRATIELLKSLIRTVWFRIPYYRYDILRGIVTVAKRLDEYSTDQKENKQVTKEEMLEIGSISENMVLVIELLVEAIQLFQMEKLDESLELSKFPHEIETLKLKEPSFKSLFVTQ